MCWHKSYDTLVVFEWQDFHKRELRKWWISFIAKDHAFFLRFIKDACSIFLTPFDWSFIKAIATFWYLSLCCVTIKDMDLIPTMDEYLQFLFLTTPLKHVYHPPSRAHYPKWLVKLLGLRVPVVASLIEFGSSSRARISPSQCITTTPPFH